MRNFCQLKQPNIFPDEKPEMFMKSNKTPGKIKKNTKINTNTQKQFSNNVAKSREEDPILANTKNLRVFYETVLYIK